MVTGSCLCGRVRYEITGPASKASHCFCSMCQKQHGGACGSYANYASADFRYTSGEEAVQRYASSSDAVRCFCSRCGSGLTWQAPERNDRIAVTLGTHDTPYAGPALLEYFTENKPAWTPTQ